MFRRFPASGRLPAGRTGECMLDLGLILVVVVVVCVWCVGVVQWWRIGVVQW